ncbi:aldehyde dehydrogenase family protein [Sphingobium sp. DC-2]|uniref:aldehyde dehydrogenase family protein n=1 Tax=Sphingobium sp. DC-2 TaxID=1303256 RepID=UPI00307CB021
MCTRVHMSKSVPVIENRWAGSKNTEYLRVIAPATGQPLWDIVCSDEHGVDAAIRAARSAFEKWRWVPALERGRILRECAEAIKPFANEIAEIESQEMGKPVIQAHMDVQVLIASFEYFGGLTAVLPSRAQDVGHSYSMTMLEPFGIIGGILPFNWPPIHTGAKSAPALAVGNAVVLKPPEQAPRTIMRIVEILNTVLPRDLLQVVPGGPDVGKALAAHPMIAKLSFTGASPTGVHVLKTLADNLTPAMMELGGKNALIVMADADLDQAVPYAIEGGFYNCGQACTASSRLLVHADIHDEFVERLVAGVSRLRLGPLDDALTTVGPVANHGQQRKVLDFIDVAQKEGATIAFQGELPSDPALAAGAWVRPTVITGVTRDMRVAREEIFGPVVAVMRFGSMEEAVEIANDTPYGLVAGVFSGDTAQALAIARRLSVSSVFINNYHRTFFGTPFGGTKHSGFGREHAPETLSEYGFTKSYRLPSGIGEMPHWAGSTSSSNS